MRSVPDMTLVPYAGTSIAPSSSTMTSNAYHHVGSATGAAYGSNAGPGKAPFRHIDDVLSVSADLDPYTPLRKVLDAGEAHMRQAITFKDFGRPDLALQEYIKAYAIFVDVPKHKDYPTLKSDRGELNRLYRDLHDKIKRNDDAFDRIKQMIKEDNARSGVRPKRIITKPPENSLHNLPSVPSSRPWSQPIDNDAVHTGRKDDGSRNASKNRNSISTDHQLHESSSLERRAKPIVHPKPQALHGKSLQPASDKASPTVKAPPDLIARFAKLRSNLQDPESSPPPSTTKLIGPRPMPIPTMPKVPDAVYNPARGTVTNEAANLPSSTPRGIFSRTNSLVSTPGRSSTESAYKPSTGEQYVTTHTYGDPQVYSTYDLRIPQGELITVKELRRCMEDASTHANTKMLLIDVRDRQLFDEGHIMSQNTICLDPTILSRRDISANEIVDSMILAPTNEKLALERRAEIDLIVFYDQDSQTIPQNFTGNMQEAVLFNLRQALVHYNFLNFNHTPKLLVGGLDAWVDEMGKQSLQTSKTQSILRHATSTSGSTRQRLKNRALKPDEVDTFEAMIGRDENGEFDYTKSRDDFMRRFPSLREPESMISASPGTFVPTTNSGGEDILRDMTPTPPVRPKPSVTRTRYSGLQSADEHPSPSSLAMAATASVGSQRNTYPTGLINPHNWCYANASIQALLACRGFVDEFLDTQWPTKYRPQVSSTDPSQNQLMCKILGHLFLWLSQRSLANMKAATLMHYLRTIHAGYSIGNGKVVRFGDNNQHDSDEFITFIFGQLEVETRIKLTMNVLPPLDTTQPVGFVANRWGNRGNHNVISRYWYLMELQTLTCKTCGTRNFIAEEAERYQFSVPAHRNDGTLDELIKEHFDDLHVETECDKCGARGKILRRQIVRLPPLLRVGIQRTDQTSSVKLVNNLQFPLDGLDLSRYALDPQQRAQIAKLVGGEAGEGFDCAAKYDLFAVVAHQGATLNLGHYICYVKEPNSNRWIRCNDTTIEPNIGLAEIRSALYECESKGFTPVQLYYRRVDATY